MAGNANTGTDEGFAARIDARGLACPQPVLMLRAALRTLPSGARVELLATDPLAGVDVQAYCARTGHRVAEESTCNGEIRFVLVARA